MAALQAAAAALPADLPALQVAIQHAQTAGVFSYKIKDFVKILGQERHKEEARAALREATALRSAEAVGAALDHCREMGVAGDELCDAGRMHKELIKEMRQEEAREQLEKAVTESWDLGALDQAIQDATFLDLECAEFATALRRSARMHIADALFSGDDDACLDAAISRGRAAGLEESELADASERLQALRRDQVKRRFGEALRLRDPRVLEDAVWQGRLACLVEQEVSAMYQEFGEECARYAREQLKTALDRNDANTISEAIDQSSAHLEQEELREARRVLARLQLSAASRRAAGAPVRSNVEHLRRLLDDSIGNGIGEESRAEAQETLAWAEENIREELCDICYDEDETNTMPCCGRDTGGGRICSACLAKLLHARGYCPFCRESIR